MTRNGYITMNNTQHCLSSDDIRTFLEGQSTQDEDSAMVAHLDRCQTCRTALEEDAGGAKWLGQVHDLLSDAEFDATTDEQIENIRTPADLFLVANRLTFLAPTDDPRMIGRMGVYEVSGVIGCGGMGVILKALEPSLNRYVALKILWPHLAVHGAARQRFAREARAAAAVVHEHVVPIYAVDEFQGIPYIVMQYVPGRSLQERISRDGALSIEQVLRIGRQIATALEAAHAQGLVHRDVKPGNILLENGIERVLVTDFGLARAADDASLTHSGMVAGTPQFMSPEQVRGDVIDHRSDLFSLGSVLYTMCAGHPPFRAETVLGSLTRICNEIARPLREINASVPEWLDTFIARLMSKDSIRRFQSASEVVRILEEELAHLQNPVCVTRPDRTWTRRKWTRATRRAAVATAIGITFLGWLTLTNGTWRMEELFPQRSEIEATSVERSKIAENTTESLVRQPAANDLSGSLQSMQVLGSAMPNDPTVLEISEVRTAVEELERRLTLHTFDVSDWEDPWNKAQQATSDLEQQLTPGRSEF